MTLEKTMLNSNDKFWNKMSNNSSRKGNKLCLRPRCSCQGSVLVLTRKLHIYIYILTYIDLIIIWAKWFRRSAVSWYTSCLTTLNNLVLILIILLFFISSVRQLKWKNSKNVTSKKKCWINYWFVECSTIYSLFFYVFRRKLSALTLVR